MFNKSLIAFSLMALSGAALSAPIANLKVDGKITPPTCTVNGGDSTDLMYNFGDISPVVIPQDSNYNGLPTLSNSLTVTCDAETFLTFKATDNYPNDFILTPGMNVNFKAHAFSLVDSADTTKTVGGVTYKWDNVTVDGEPAYISRANDGTNDNGTWSPADFVVKNATNGWTSEQQKHEAPSALKLRSGKTFAASIRNYGTSSGNGLTLTYLHSQAMLSDAGIDISNGLDYVGQVVLTFNFGV